MFIRPPTHGIPDSPDDVEEDHQAPRVRGVDELLQPLRSAVDLVRAVEQRAVVAPSALAAELGDGEELDRGDPGGHQMIELADDRLEGSLRRECPDVQLVEDGLVPGGDCQDFRVWAGG